MKCSYEFDQDPRYGWVRVELGDSKDALIVVQDTDGKTYGFNFREGEMTPSCICSAREQSECACPGVEWD